MFKEGLGGLTYETGYSYDDDDRPTTVSFGTFSRNWSYDAQGLSRVTGLTIRDGTNTLYSTQLGVTPGDGSVSIDSSRVSSINNGGEVLTYSYDDRGFITQVYKDANNYTQYRYDGFGQLIRENYKWAGTAYTKRFHYDVGGNITAKVTYAFVDGDRAVGTALETIGYGYTDSVWKDKLTSFNGNTITYDEIGNPLSDGTWTYTWTQGRKLQLYYSYDASGSLWAMQYNGSMYFTIRNAQGDVIKLVDSSGAVVVEYVYDAWGKLMGITGSLTSTLGVDNPYRYRGYRYDNETGLYSLSSRYYDPTIGRFINADTPDVLLASPDSPNWDKNLYAYCDNDPINRADPDGEIWNWIVGGIVGAVAGATVSIVSQAISGNGINWRSVGASAAAGAVTGLLMATPGAQGVALTMGQTMLWGAAASGAGYVTYNAVNGSRSTWKGLAYSMAFGALSAGFGYKLSNPSACFVAGTTVLTAEGHVPIETIEIGDMVWAENHETGEKSLKRVAQTFFRETDQFVHIKVDGQDITTTPEHPFWVLQKGWTDAIELSAGDTLILQDGKQVIIEHIQHELLESPVTVYNFEVEDYHTYYVTDSSILVHNTCGFANFRTLNNTTIKGYKVSMDLERGGSGLINIHLKVGSTKYFWNGTDFVNSAGKGIPNSLKEMQQ